MKVYYAPEIPEVIQKTIRSSVEQYRFLLPRWCGELTVLWQPKADGEGTACEMITFEDYRSIQLIIHPDFVVAPVDKQFEYLRHEFIHPVLQPTKKVQIELMEALDLEKENPALCRWAENLIREANEKAVQDLADALEVPDELIEEEARRVLQHLMQLSMNDPDARELALEIVSGAIKRRNCLATQS